MLPNVFSLATRKLVATAGFTMIELLVVISVIGVLAVAVLSSINPIEQINKGRDTRTRSDAAQLINAVDRYFSIHEQYPWNTQTDTFTPSIVDYEDAFEFDETGAIQGAETDWNWLDILTTTAEVKSGFSNRLKVDDQADYLMVKADGANSTMYACFMPSSNAFDQEASNRCASGALEDDYPSEACPSDCDDSYTDTNRCMVCLP